MTVMEQAVIRAGLQDNIPPRKRHLGMEGEIREAGVEAVASLGDHGDALSLSHFMRDVLGYAKLTFQRMAR